MDLGLFAVFVVVIMAGYLAARYLQTRGNGRGGRDRSSFDATTVAGVGAVGGTAAIAGDDTPHDGSSGASGVDTGGGWDGGGGWGVGDGGGGGGGD